MDLNQIATALQALNDKIDNLTGINQENGARLANSEKNQAHIDQIRNTP